MKFFPNKIVAKSDLHGQKKVVCKELFNFMYSHLEQYVN